MAESEAPFDHNWICLVPDSYSSKQKHPLQTGFDMYSNIQQFSTPELVQLPIDYLLIFCLFEEEENWIY